MESRFKSYLAQDNKYVLVCNCYVELNRPGREYYSLKANMFSLGIN